MAKRRQAAITVATNEYWKLDHENAQLRKVLTALVNTYVANQGTSSQFVACVTPDGNMKMWDDAMRALGRRLHIARRRGKCYLSS
jgi:hypothetical protein